MKKGAEAAAAAAEKCKKKINKCRQRKREYT